MARLRKPETYPSQARWLAWGLAALLTVPTLAQAAEFSLVSPASPPLTGTAERPGFLDELAAAVFQRIGIEAKLTRVPGERALLNVDSGLDDGDFFRAPDIETDYPRLLRVPEPVMLYEFVAYTRRQDITLRTWSDLQPYAVAYPNGWKIFEHNVRHVKDLTVTPSIHELFPLLEADRVDVILISRWAAQPLIRQHGYKYRALDPPLARVNMYMYLNRKHAALVPRLAQALRDMKADGSYQEIYARTLTSLGTR